VSNFDIFMAGVTILDIELYNNESVHVIDSEHWT